MLCYNFVSFIIEIGGNDACKSFSQCACYRNYCVIIFGVFSYINGNGNTPKLSYSQFVEKLDKGDLKTLEIQPEQNVYLVSGKQNDNDFIQITKITNEAKGDLKTLEIQPEQNVYLVSGKTKMMKITLQRFYTITKKTYKNYK